MRFCDRSYFPKIALFAFLLIPSILPAQITEVWSARFNGTSNTVDVSKLSAGVYIYTLRVRNFVASKKLLLMR